MAGATLSLRIEEHSQERVVSFFVNCANPEEAAWNLLREWVAANIEDCATRRYIGCAPRGHHPHGEDHQPDEETGTHEYTAQMLLYPGEGSDATFRGAVVCAAPAGLFLVGEVALNVFNADGTVDMGSSMERSFGGMSERLEEMGCYTFDFNDRPYYEEHVFSAAWFAGRGELAAFKLWLPVVKV